MLPEHSTAEELLKPQASQWLLVTIIVPVYNHARYVVACLDSIVTTHYPALEIIILNDCSQDDSDKIIRGWINHNPQLNVIYIQHQQNQGLTKSLNEAITRARGEFVCLLAGDDVLLPNGIDDRVQYLLEHPTKLAVFADCHVIDQGGKQVVESGIEQLHPKVGMRKRYLHTDTLLHYSVVFQWAVPGPVFLCRKSLFDRVGGYDEELLVEDWDMYLRCSEAGVLGFCESYVANYRVHQASMIQRNAKSNFLQPSFTRMFEKHLPKLDLLARTRLHGYLAAVHYVTGTERWRRIHWLLLHKALMLSTNLSYRMLRYMLYRQYVLRVERSNSAAGRTKRARPI